MKHLVTIASASALLFSSLAGAQQYQFQQRINGLAASQTGQLNGVIYDEDGWALLQDSSNGQQVEVTDEQWILLRDAMTEGVRVDFNDGVSWYASAQMLRSANCSTIDDIDSLQPDTVRLAHEEVTGCTMGGRDYSVLMIKRPGQYSSYQYNYAGKLFTDIGKTYKIGSVKFWIK